ncbi:MAG TPA: T9SS type A sorting domain-containing protein [Chitinophagaceae bacterium]|nr:T9SS type A sorting domain-containing protein [Chitinophagaceae bacterium]
MQTKIFIPAYAFLLLAAYLFPILSSAQTASAARYSSFAICTDKTVMGWGANGYGQLGNGTSSNSYNVPVQMTGMTDAIAVAGGYYHSLILKANGRVWASGYNGFGQFGDGTNNDSNVPVLVMNGITTATAIASGQYHSLVLKSDGTVWASGYNLYGQLGDGTTVDRTTPVQVTGLTGVIAIGCGDQHSLAVKSDGTAWAWGWNTLGQLGDGTTTDSNVPVQVTGLTNAKATAGGLYHSMVLKTNGTVWTWGFGPLGDGGSGSSLVPVQVSGLTGVIKISSGIGSSHCLSVKSDGTAWAWGSNLIGQLGDGTTIDRPTPVQVTGLTGVLAISGGESHSFALLSDGSGRTWGQNIDGQLGNGNNTPSSVPIAPTGLCGIFVLPVGLMSFDCHRVSGSINLVEWATASENNNDYFILERSRDSRLWENIANIRSKAPGGNSTQAINYSYTDHTPYNETNYYRLKQVDMDGKAAYSKIVIVRKTDDVKGIKIFPKPVTDQVSIEFSNMKGSYIIHIYDVAGREMMKQVAGIGYTVQYVRINRDNIAGGLYIISVKNAGNTESYTERVVFGQ